MQRHILGMGGKGKGGEKRAMLGGKEKVARREQGRFDGILMQSPNVMLAGSSCCSGLSVDLRHFI